jgi:hypothetical protein
MLVRAVEEVMAELEIVVIKARPRRRPATQEMLERLEVQGAPAAPEIMVQLVELVD